MLRGSVRPFVIAAVTTLVIAVLLALPDLITQDGADAWDSLFTERNTLWYFCEPPQIDRFIRQPSDTYSNLGFLFVGVVMLGFAQRDRKSRAPTFIVRNWIWSVLYGWALVLTFLGSGFFHASLTWFGEWIDLVAVFAVGWLPVVVNFHRLQEAQGPQTSSRWLWLAVYLALWLLSSYSIFRVKAWFTFPAVLGLIGLSSVWVQVRCGTRRSRGWMMGSIGLTLLAIMWFVFDIKRIGCDPESWFQPHAMWHLTNAAAAGCFYGFMRRVG
ncbi:MAG: hypothetical protein AAF998_27845 [Bacteroidota bacterium]